MQIRVFKSQKSYLALLHYLVTDNNELLAASFAGHTPSVNAVIKAINNGESIDLVDNYTARRLNVSGEYQCFIAKGEYTSHGVVLHERFFREQENTHTILSEDGNIEAVSDLLINRFALPQEWRSQYPEIFKEYISELTVIKNPDITSWSNLKAYKVQLDERTMKRIIGSCLKNEMLRIPECQDRGSFDPSWDLRTYLRQNAAEIAEEIKRKMEPYHNQFDPNRKLLKDIATIGRIPLPAQADVVQALYNRFQDSRYAFVNGATGSGKTIIMTALCNVIHRHVNKNKYTPILYTAPSQIIPKTIQNEILVDLIHAKITKIESIEDALHFIKRAKTPQPDIIEFVIISIDQAKQGPLTWAGAALWKRIRGTKLEWAWHCPDCFGVLPDPELKDENREPLPASWESMACNEEIEKDRTKIIWNQNSRLRKCPHCGAKLWRPATKQACDYGAKSPRWYISKLFKKKLKTFFDLYVADEVHKQRSAPQRGLAFGHLVKSARKTLGLTATLNNGVASTARDLLWRVAPSELIKKGFNYNTGPIAWAKVYGAVEKKRRHSLSSGRTSSNVFERPGVSPRLTVEYLMGCTAFLELEDLGFPLPEKKEIVVFVDLDENHKAAYDLLHRRLLDFCGRGARGNIIPTVLNYADNPSEGASVTVKWRHRGWRSSHVEERTITAPPIPGYSAKERKLVEIVRDNLAENRGCVVFNRFTGMYKTNQRIQKILRDHGIDSAILPSNLGSDKRLAWLEKKAEEGQKVIISNINLIGEGLDLLGWPSIIFYQLDGNIDIVRQAGGRAWRIGQMQECRNYYILANGTQQIPAFETVMARRGHALLVEGKIDRSVLSNYARDAFTTLAADIALYMDREQAVNQWQEFARAEMLVETVSEDKYKEAVQRAIKKLTEQTKRLCGIEDDFAQPWMPDGFKLLVIDKTMGRGRRKIVAGQLSLVSF